MPQRTPFSRVSRAFGRPLRRLTIGLGSLILVFHYFGGQILEAWLYPVCSEWPISTLANARGDVAEVTVHGCILGLFNRQYRIRVRPADGSPARIIVRFDPKGRPALYWLDVDRLQAVLGNVRSLTPQIAQVGPVHIAFIYRGANPSLD